MISHLSPPVFLPLVRTRSSIAGLVGIEDVAVVAVNLPRVLVVSVYGGGVSDLGAGAAGSGAAGECPNSLGVIALEGIDGEYQLRLGLLQRNKRRKRRNDKGRYKTTRIAPLARWPAGPLARWPAGPLANDNDRVLITSTKK